MATDKEKKKPVLNSAVLQKKLKKLVAGFGKVQFFLISIVVLAVLGFTILAASRVGSAKADENALQQAIIEAGQKRIQFDQEAIEQVNTRTQQSQIVETNRNDPFSFSE